MVLDDSSGANIEVTCGRASPAAQNGDINAATVHTPVREQARMIGNTTQGNNVDLTVVDIGSIVKVKGGIGCFRGEKQMTLERLSRYYLCQSSPVQEATPIVVGLCTKF